MPLSHLIHRSQSPLVITVLFAIAIATANFSASAQSSKATNGAQSASVVATGAPQPGAVASPAAAGIAPLDAHGVIAYLTDVINWYGHLGTEAQLVRDPDETLFFANDRQTAGEVLRLAFESARAQAAFIAKTRPAAGTIAPGNSVSGSAALSNIAQNAATLNAASDALRARIKDAQAKLAKAPARQRAAITAQ